MKKSHTKNTKQNRWFIIAACVVIVLAIIRQPSLRTALPLFGNYDWQQFIGTVQKNQAVSAQQLWEFREFFSRGEIFLNQNHQLEIPSQIASTFTLPQDFKPYLIFKSEKTISLEGSTSVSEIGSILNQEKDFSFLSPTSAIWQSPDGNFQYIVANYSIAEAAEANGYLYFDLRDENFAQSVHNKRWLVLTVIEL